MSPATDVSRNLQGPRGSWFISAAIGVASFGCLALSPAMAQQHNPADSQCAIYGAGFVAVQGATTCVRIGGRVRVDYDSRGVPGHAYAPSPQQPAFPPSGGDGLNRAHLKIDPFSRR